MTGTHDARARLSEEALRLTLIWRVIRNDSKTKAAPFAESAAPKTSFNLWPSF
jgi:hypothetical protein